MGSTNDEAMARLRNGASAVWVTAERQLKGRGRRGRTWVSEPGNLYASYGCNLSWPVERIGLIPLAAAVALAGAIEGANVDATADTTHDASDETSDDAGDKTSDDIMGDGSDDARQGGDDDASDDADHPISAKLKWPNDVLVDGKKCAGILIETERGATAAVQRVVTGFGVNIAHAPQDTPAIALQEKAPHLTAQDVFARLSSIYSSTLDALAGEGGITALRNRWLARAIGLGQEITVRYESHTQKGRFLGLDPGGRLILGEDGGNTRLIAAGDVFMPTERL
ncbi:MAG: biotin--[acetyl-CoA-carboxylase] ligase [Pseudomonadota bacterium]